MCALFLVTHASVLAYAIVVLQIDLHLCQSQFIPFVLSDALLGLLSIPQIYANYFST